MQEFSRKPPLHNFDLSGLVTAVRHHSSYFSVQSLRASIEQAVFEDGGGILEVTEVEENAFRSFLIEQSEALEKIRAECFTTTVHCGVDVELRGGGFEKGTWSPGVPEFFLSKWNSFTSYVEAIAAQGRDISNAQELSVVALVDSLLCQMRQVYRVNDPSDEYATSFIAALPRLHQSIEILARSRNLFQPIHEELKVLQWILGHDCADEVLSCSRAGAYSMQSLLIHDGNLHLNSDQQRFTPASSQWYRETEDVQVFLRKWQNLEQKIQILLSFPKLSEFTRSVVCHLQGELLHAKLDIVPNSSCLDAPNADCDYRAAIDDIYDQLSTIFNSN